MVVHICLKCKKEFNKKSMYIAHINKKFDCTPNNIIIEEPQKLLHPPQNILNLNDKDDKENIDLFVQAYAEFEKKYGFKG